ncbi:hypothetical protein OSI29_24300, partial [Mycobacterium ulcerans]|nr:hypothetical protein [Mycobacterium ulcerans]MEB3925661.1 hypothetical protein [Mycobacterium ulcerans]MEB3929793.1 hypothetical protein [Mycobacterium ulcerans]MEB3933933.1 hypothetical protein [Mycobacterium ulcerans]MEB3958550.1 hypothetical protein [Mycobacterium ulcerans]
RQHRRSLPDHRFDRQPPPRPPQSTISQLTSLLINNAGALRPWHSGVAPSSKIFPNSPSSMSPRPGSKKTSC